VPLQERRIKLEESLRFYTFTFEVVNQMQWIHERWTVARSEKSGQDLHTAQLLDKKHRKLEAELTGHANVIDNTLAPGQTLLQQRHPERDEVPFFTSNRTTTLECD